VPNACADAAAAPAATVGPAVRRAAGSAPRGAADADAAAARLAQAAALMPWARLRSLPNAGAVDAAPGAPAEGGAGARALEGSALLLRRLAARAEAAAFVARHDPAAAGYSVALNRFRWARSRAT
jgi:hypothetical protein